MKKIILISFILIVMGIGIFTFQYQKSDHFHQHFQNHNLIVQIKQSYDTLF